jgi:hypothetical protein
MDAMGARHRNIWKLRWRWHDIVELEILSVLVGRIIVIVNLLPAREHKCRKRYCFVNNVKSDQSVDRIVIELGCWRCRRPFA